eukprot:TRINITY_DN20348_c0_g1::TRINITY_DN20348_c0_g1_i1::g.8480::m.8480 TRINITY_DN20348_c0_g1::TRINITY_DN20348_c0_g1_i1::g.8480  ORF type:complete len:137 (-),score=-17.99,SHIPPO-rpt/PF07004.7/2.8,SHIPPO-rpt/PF07004.7/0.12,SHIPPO-rpt/PF07004.7/1.8,ECR1_N/PF14382.1/1.1e+02,ECR1_N/PF14382.1/9.7,ECR1_N/PF14382.1/1.8 TRINITY_DN20348_c0_g1_i1:163-573(-)
MAFVFRSERNTTPTIGSTPSEIGPGTYSAADAKRLKKGYAPFGSTSTRPTAKGAVQAEIVTPGPGTYQAESPPRRAVGNQPSTVFASKVERFHSPKGGSRSDGETAVKSPTGKENTPGPGTYYKQETWVKGRPAAR